MHVIFSNLYPAAHILHMFALFGQLRQMKLITLQTAQALVPPAEN